MICLLNMMTFHISNYQRVENHVAGWRLGHRVESQGVGTGQRGVNHGEMVKSIGILLEFIHHSLDSGQTMAILYTHR